MIFKRIAFILMISLLFFSCGSSDETEADDDSSVEAIAPEPQIERNTTSSGEIDMDQVYSDREFQLGVRSYHNRYYEQAIVFFQKALSHKSDNNAAREWLGRSYLRAGLSAAALVEWRDLLTIIKDNAFLENLVDTISFKRGLAPELNEGERYVVAYTIENESVENQLFKRPTSVLALDNGDFLVVSYAGNQIVQFDANGFVKLRFNGGIEGFSHPFDIVSDQQGNYFVSEFSGDRISKINSDGDKILTFGESGRGDGQLLGPQYICFSNDGYVYVTDGGNRRVAKFSEDGTFILNIGEPGVDFPGLQEPTGIIVENDVLMVFDQKASAIFLFDHFGNYLGKKADGLFSEPEGIRRLNDNLYLVADAGGAFLYNSYQDTKAQLADIKTDRLICLDKGINGNIFAVDFNSNSIVILSELSSFYTGLYVRIDGVDSSKFPEIIMDFTVEDRYGRPILGLNLSNILVTEGRRNVGEVELIYSGFKARGAEVALIMETSSHMQAKGPLISTALEGILDTVKPIAKTRMILAEEISFLAARPEDSNRLYIEAAKAGEYSENWNLSAAIKLAVSDLLKSRNPRHIVFIHSGSEFKFDMAETGLQELVGLMQYNGVRFSVISLEDTTLPRELKYLVDHTNGYHQYIFIPSGLHEFSDFISYSRSGNYAVKYASPNYTDFGQRYIPAELEVQFIKRSGRDESGYFGPIE